MDESGAGIASANLRLMRAGDVVAETITDQHGVFAFTGVIRGQYRVIAEKASYVDILSSLSTVRGVSADFDEPIRLTLWRVCAISGRVYGLSGEPVQGHKVVALARRTIGESDDLVEHGVAGLTDDRGVYRVYGIPPGRYTVALVPDLRKTGPVSFSPVYFPGVVETNRADFFLLKPGEQRQGVDFTLSATTPGFTVGGVVTGIPGGWNPYGIPGGWNPYRITVSLFTEAGRAVGTVYADSNGHFLIRDVPAGTYSVVARGPVYSWGDEGPEADVNGRQGSQQITVRSSEVNNVEIELHQLGAVATQFESATLQCLQGELTLTPVSPRLHAAMWHAEIASGGATIHGVPRGRYRLRVRNLRDGCYVSTVRQVGTESEAGLVEVNGNTRVGLTLSVADGVVSGRVSGPDERPAPVGTPVVLVAESGERVMDYIRTAPTRADGTFRFDHVPPGFYRATAFRSIDLSDLDLTGTRFVLEREGSAQVELRLNP